MEALVIFACTNNYGCTETLNNYYIYNPTMKEALYKGEVYVQNHVPQLAFQYLAPILTYAARNEGNFRINKQWSVNISTKDGAAAKFSYSF